MKKIHVVLTLEVPNATTPAHCVEIVRQRIDHPDPEPVPEDWMLDCVGAVNEVDATPFGSAMRTLMRRWPR
jgi:hypothetical protein